MVSSYPSFPSSPASQAYPPVPAAPAAEVAAPWGGAAGAAGGGLPGNPPAALPTTASGLPRTYLFCERRDLLFVRRPASLSLAPAARIRSLLAVFPTS